ncbi:MULTISPECIES: hypothetical protein [unclassified Mameliella]|uniref:hypothetical protein n=1 Tax=Mameliella sp. LZ-28 TaxID=2484146 RepID=UPI00143F998F|nr:hypothetical protein [Mameliella sp. LZ-28]
MTRNFARMTAVGALMATGPVYVGIDWGRPVDSKPAKPRDPDKRAKVKAARKQALANKQRRRK